MTGSSFLGAGTNVPIPVNNENGIRNFNEAVKRSQNLVSARLFFSARVSKATTKAKTVDCHR
jgi:hypothetical protein